jgi:hypothetical protein
MQSAAVSNHWELRDQAASLLGAICRHFSEPYHNVQPQVCRVLGKAWTDPSKALETKYGAVVGLRALGPSVVRALLLPCLEPYVSEVLLPSMGGCSSSSSGNGAAAAGVAAAAAAAGGGSVCGVWKEAAAVAGSEISQGISGSERAAAAAALAAEGLRGDGDGGVEGRGQQQQQVAAAWMLYGALLSSLGGGMYDQLIGAVREKIPLQMVLARQQYLRKVVAWDEVERREALKRAAAAAVAERVPRLLRVGLTVGAGGEVGLLLKVLAGNAGTRAGAAAMPAVVGAGVGGDALGGGGGGKVGGGSTGDGAAPMEIDGGVSEGGEGARQAAGASGSGAEGGAQGLVQKQQHKGSKQQGKKTFGEVSEAIVDGVRLAGVLSEAWKEDSDVNATLGALCHLFGEDMLPYLPHSLLPSFSL